MMSSYHSPTILLLLALSTSILSQVNSLASPSPSPPTKIHSKNKWNPNSLKVVTYKASHKKPGSVGYKTDWRRYSNLALESIRQQVAENLPNPVDDEATDALRHALGHAADEGKMPSFSDAGARAGYALGLFGRARLLADLIFLDTVEPPFNLDGSDGDLHLLAKAHTDNKCCNILSIGGGPGYDFVSAALVASFLNDCAARASQSSQWHRHIHSHSQTNLTIHTTVYDYEAGWADLVEIVTDATQEILGNNQFECKFGGRCDITLPLMSKVNADVLSKAQAANVIVCQYCVAENAARLRDSGFAFFRELFELVPQEAVLVFTETTHRLWPEIVELKSANGFEVSFPFPKRGRNGKCMILRKTLRKGAIVDTAEHLELLQEFAHHQEMNARRQQKGFIRQQKKIRV